jgi:hypothetical protein
MRPLALFLVLMIGLAVVPAPGGTANAAAASETATPKKAPIHIQATPAPRAKPAKTARQPLPVPVNTIASPIPTDAGQCRLGCAQAYYFCLSAADADDCGGTWTTCRSDCARAAANP